MKSIYTGAKQIAAANLCLEIIGCLLEKFLKVTGT